MDEWMEVNKIVKKEKENEILLRFIKPLVQKLRSEFKIAPYHFLHEPDNEIRFRVLTNSGNIEKVIGLINNAKGMLQVRDIKYPEHPYAGEKDAFGEDGWTTTFRYLEAGSDFALDLLD